MTLILLVGWMLVVKETRVINLEKYNTNCPELFSKIIVLEDSKLYTKYVFLVFDFLRKIFIKRYIFNFRQYDTIETEKFKTQVIQLLPIYELHNMMSCC